MAEKKTIHVIGGGLAGSECAFQLANRGHRVKLYEMRGETKPPAHKTDRLAELVCSNSFRSDDHEYNAVGLLHEEMRRLNSLIMREGGKAAVPASIVQVNVEPLPRPALSTVIVPPISSASRLEMARPRPVPP